MITVIDLKAYTEASSKNYKQIPIENAIPATVCTEFSRYEVLRACRRKLYFDIDGVPEDKPKLIDDFIKAYNNFLIQNHIVNKPLSFIKTTNGASETHRGLSYHLICPTHCAPYFQQRDALLAFKHTEEGKPFNDYADTSVYSKLRLFKLPNFIGIPMTNPENYHRMDPTYPNSKDYIIQDTDGCQCINMHFSIQKGWRKTSVRISPLLQAVVKLATLLENPQAPKKENATPIKYSFEDIIKRIDALLSKTSISALDRKMLQDLRNECGNENSNIPTIANGLLSLLEEKYKQ